MPRLVPPLLAMLLGAIALGPLITTMPPDPDEDQYAWSAAYFGGKAAELDFSPTSGPDPYNDPGWAPREYWGATQPMGTRLIYAVVLGLSRSEVPERPFNWEYRFNWEDRWFDSLPTYRGLPDELLTPTRHLLRFAASTCAALGLGLIAWRLQWWGLAAVAVFLFIPHVRADLVLAWAEGPLLLGLGLAIAAYGTRFLGPALGLAATFKLTALALWPLMLVKGSAGAGRWRLLSAVIAAFAVWTALDPPSWYLGGPAYIFSMLGGRLDEYRVQSEFFPGPTGLHLPTRYLLPFEILGLLGLAVIFRERRWYAALSLAHGRVQAVRGRLRGSLDPSRAPIPARASSLVSERGTRLGRGWVRRRVPGRPVFPAPRLRWSSVPSRVQLSAVG